MIHFVKASTQKHFFDLCKLRIEVFVIEQNVDATIEIDEEDGLCDHYLAYDHDTAIAVCRIIKKDENACKVGRFCVKKAYRRKNIGQQLFYFVEKQLPDIKEYYLDAQVHAIPFYESFGFKAYGEVHLDQKIPHRYMKKIWNINP